MTLISTKNDKSYKQVKNSILRHRIENHCVDAFYWHKNNRLAVAIFFYDDNSIGLHVKQKPSTKEIIVILKELKQNLLRLSGDWFCVCEKNAKSGNRLAKMAGFEFQETYNQYNIYVW